MHGEGKRKGGERKVKEGNAYERMEKHMGGGRCKGKERKRREGRRCIGMERDE